MELTFKEICDHIAGFVSDQGDGVKAFIKREVGLAYADMARDKRWRELIAINELYSYTAGTNYLALPSDVATVYAISSKTVDITPGNVTIETLIDRWIAVSDSNYGVYEFTEIGPRPISKPLPADATISVFSSSSGDTTGKVRIKGVDSNNLVVSEELPLNGATKAVSNTTWRKGWSIHSVTLTRAANGTISIEEDNGDTIIGKIPSKDTQSEYYIVILAAPPSTAENLYIAYKRKVKPLIDDNDVPIIPVSRALIETVKGKMLQFDRKHVQARDHILDGRSSANTAISEQRNQSSQVPQVIPDIAGRGFYRGY